MVNGNLTAIVRVSYNQLAPFHLFQFYFELALAGISLFCCVYSIYFIFRHDLPSRGLRPSIETVLSPVTFLMVLVFLFRACFFANEAVFYAQLYPASGFGLFFFVMSGESSIAWFSWLRSKAVISLHYKQWIVDVLQYELIAAPIILISPCIIQFLPILNSVQYATIPTALGIAMIINVDLLSLRAYFALIFSLKSSRVDIPPAYMVIAKYTSASTILRITSLIFYSVSAFIQNDKTAMTCVMLQDIFMILDAINMLIMKAALVKPGLFEILPMKSGGGFRSKGAKGKVNQFLDGSGSSSVTKPSSSST